MDYSHISWVGNRFQKFVLITGILAGSLCMLPVAAHAQSWQTVPPMKEARIGHTATLLPDGRVLVVGGMTSLQDYTNTQSVEIFNPVTLKWDAAANLPNKLSAHTATLLSDGRVLVTGGRVADTWGETPAALVYTPQTNQWKPVASMMIHKSQHAATRLADGKVLVTGGSNPGPADGGWQLDIAEVYDPKTNQWTTASPMPTPRALHQSFLLTDGRVLITGGRINSSAKLVDSAYAQVYAPQKNQWQSLRLEPDAKTVQWEHSAAALLANQQLLIVGGYNQSQDASSGDRTLHRRRSELLDVNAQRWGKTDEDQTWFPWRVDASLTLLADGRVLLSGGSDYWRVTPDGVNYASKSVQVYDASQGTWKQLPVMNVARTRHTATLLPDGRVLVLGGVTSQARGKVGPVTPSAEVFDPGH